MKTSTLPYAARAAGLVGSVIDSSTSLLHKQTHDVVRFAMGSPASEAVPSEILSGIAAIELSKPDAYDYAATEGDPPLHAALLEMLRGTSDETTADRLTITAGGMQGLDPFCKIFVDPGDLVTVESPTYSRRSRTCPQGELHDPDLPESVRRHAVVGASAAAPRAGPGMGFNGDRRRPLRVVAVRG